MSTSPLADALSNLLFACLPLRNVLKGDARTAFMAAWRAGTDALCNGVFKPDEEAVKAPREAAIELFRHTLDACAGLGVKPHDLVPLFNDRADGGFTTQKQPLDALSLLGRSALRTARLTLDRKDDAA